MKTNLSLIFITSLAVCESALAQAATNAPSAPSEDHSHGICGGVVMVAVDRGPVLSPASGTFHIAVSFDNGVTSAQRTVIQQAINEWDAIIQSRGVTPGNYPITIRYGTLGGITLASTSVTYDSNSGDLISAAMTIDSGRLWYEDADPATDDEFSRTPLPAGFDLLSVVRHELGHALGWVDSAHVNSLVANNVFDASRLNIGLVPGDSAHASASAHPLELMQPSIDMTTRRAIRLYPTVAYLARAYQYQIPMQFVDPNYSGTHTGNAWQPWQTVPAAMTQAPAGLPLLLAPASLAVARNQMLGTAHTLQAARGGAVVFAP